jgi:hypothetical protein
MTHIRLLWICRAIRMLIKRNCVAYLAELLTCPDSGVLDIVDPRVYAACCTEEDSGSSLILWWCNISRPRHVGLNGELILDKSIAGDEMMMSALRLRAGCGLYTDEILGSAAQHNLVSLRLNSPKCLKSEPVWKQTPWWSILDESLPALDNVMHFKRPGQLSRQPI